LSDRLGRDLDDFTRGGWRRNGLPVFLETFQVKFNGLMNQGQDFFARIASSNATGKVRNIGPERRRAFLDYYQVSHLVTLFLEPGLLQNTIQSARRYIDARLPSHRDGTGFFAMVILAVASLYPDLKPAVGLKQGN
jgi:hypothetical protein